MRSHPVSLRMNKSCAGNYAIIKQKGIWCFIHHTRENESCKDKKNNYHYIFIAGAGYLSDSFVVGCGAEL